MTLPKFQDFNIVKRFLLKLLTRLQVACLMTDNDKGYIFFTKIHFKLFFGLKKNLINDVANDTVEGRAALERHGEFVVDLFYDDKAAKTKERVHHLAVKAFYKDLILQMKL